MDIKLDPETFRAAIGNSILSVLSAEQKENIILQAVKSILAPSTNSWDKNKSPIEVAFEQAVFALAQQECQTMVQEDQEIREKIKALLRTTANKILSVSPEKMAERMANAFCDAMRKD